MAAACSAWEIQVGSPSRSNRSSNAPVRMVASSLRSFGSLTPPVCRMSDTATASFNWPAVRWNQVVSGQREIAGRCAGGGVSGGQGGEQACADASEGWVGGCAERAVGGVSGLVGRERGVIGGAQECEDGAPVVWRWEFVRVDPGVAKGGAFLARLLFRWCPRCQDGLAERRAGAGIDDDCGSEAGDRDTLASGHDDGGAVRIECDDRLQFVA